jgi:divalent metal cation (Fe/Co/Zn/Cd) transporter
VRMSVYGLMDTALPAAELAALRRLLDGYATEGIQYHALRTRESAARRFVSLHVLVPGDWTVHRGHALLERIEADIRRVVPNVTVLTHLESLDDPASWDDQALDRKA